MILGRKERHLIRDTGTDREKITIRMAYREDWDDAMAVAWKTFMQFDAKDYTQEGIESFKDFVTDTVLKKMFDMGAYQVFVATDIEGKIIGMISLRNEIHISLLFVDAKYHRNGIGRALIEELCRYVRDEEGYQRVTVNAAPYALEFYHTLGFKDMGIEQTKDGIKYTPMEKKLGWR